MKFVNNQIEEGFGCIKLLKYIRHLTTDPKYKKKNWGKGEITFKMSAF